jgi:hypothetical protein
MESRYSAVPPLRLVVWPAGLRQVQSPFAVPIVGRTDDTHMRKPWRNIAIGAGVLLAAGVVAGPVRAWRDVRAAEVMFRSGDPGRRALALRRLASGRTCRGDAVVREALCGPDARIRRDAARAIAAARRTDMAGELQAAWGREDDAPTRGSMVFYWAQVAGGSAELVLRPMMAGDEPWTAEAAAKALMRLGDPQAAEQVFSAAAGPGEGPGSGWRIDARKELQSLAVPMAAMIGQKIEIADVQPVDCGWGSRRTRATEPSSRGSAPLQGYRSSKPATLLDGTRLGGGTPANTAGVAPGVLHKGPRTTDNG